MRMRNSNKLMKNLPRLAYGLLLSLMVISTVFGQTVDSNKPLQAVYDRSKDQTIFFISSIMTVAEEAGREVYVVNDGKTIIAPSTITKMVVYFKFQGRQKSIPTSVVLAFDAGSYYGFRFNKHRSLTVKTPEKIDLGPMNLTERKNDGPHVFGFIKYWETLELPIDVGLYRRVIDSKKVAMQIGDDTVSVSEAQLKQLRSLADKHLK